MTFHSKARFESNLEALIGFGISLLAHQFLPNFHEIRVIWMYDVSYIIYVDTRLLFVIFDICKATIVLSYCNGDNNTGLRYPASCSNYTTPSMIILQHHQFSQSTSDKLSCGAFQVHASLWSNGAYFPWSIWESQSWASQRSSQFSWHLMSHCVCHLHLNLCYH